MPTKRSSLGSPISGIAAGEGDVIGDQHEVAGADVGAERPGGVGQDERVAAERRAASRSASAWRSRRRSRSSATRPERTITGTPSSRPATSSPRCEETVETGKPGSSRIGDADGIGDGVGEAAEAGAEDEADRIGQIAARPDERRGRGRCRRSWRVAEREGGGEQFGEPPGAGFRRRSDRRRGPACPARRIRRGAGGSRRTASIRRPSIGRRTTAMSAIRRSGPGDDAATICAIAEVSAHQPSG